MNYPRSSSAKIAVVICAIAACTVAYWLPTPTSSQSRPTVVPPQYQIFDIGVVQTGDTASQGLGVSPNGIAVGRSLRTNAAQAFSWTQGGGLIGLSNFAGRPYAVANGANVTGMIVGTVATTSVGSGRLPVIWQNGNVNQLPLPGNQTLGDAYSINSSGIAVGSVDAGTAQRGVIYNCCSGTVITQNTSTGCYWVTAFGINDSGRVVGIGRDPNNAARNVGMVYDNGGSQSFEVGGLPGGSTNGAISFAISNAGHIVGSTMMNQGAGVPFIWTPATGMIAIPLAEGTTQGSGRGVNSVGWVVGQDSSAFSIPFLYDGMTTYRLQDLIPANSGWDLSMNTSSSAMGISEDFTIVGTGVYNGQTHAFAMVPTGPAPILGTYPDTTIRLSSNGTVTPSMPPMGVTRINISSSSILKANLTGDLQTGVIRITNPIPANVPPATYPITVKAFGPGGSTTTSFNLTVVDSMACTRIPNFVGTNNVAVGTRPLNMALGDFDSDGNQDMAVVNFSAGGLSIRLGDGSGGFTGNTSVSLGAAPLAVAVGDFNGDGKEDLAVATDVSSGDTKIMIGNGSGAFTVANFTSVGSFPSAIAVGDFNHDGNQDLAVVRAMFPEGRVAIRLGNGLGGLSTAPDVRVGSIPASIAIGDFNSDGNQDMAVGNSEANTVSVRFGDGTGGFTGTTEVPAGTRARAVAIGDFNRDGKQDLAIGNSSSGTVSIRLGDGAGGFVNMPDVPVGISPYGVAVGDFNGDNKQDILVPNNGGNNVSVRLGNGLGGFTGGVEVSVGTTPNTLALGDFNNDGRQDFVVTNENSNNVSVKLGTCTSQQFDFDGDLRADVGVFRPSSGIWYLLQSTAGFSGINWGFSSDKIAPADYDGDGKTDIAVYRPSEGNWYALRSSNGTLYAVNFGISEDLPVPADYDNDGKADVAVYRPSTGTWWVLRTTGGLLSANFGASEDKPVAGDWDGDGRADLGVFRPSSGTWYYSSDFIDPAHHFTAVPFGLSTDLVTPADFDGDGKTDVAVYRPSNGVWYRLNSSDGAFIARQFGTSEDIPSAGDFDGDGRADISVFRPSSGVWYRLNSGNGSFFAVQFGINGDRPTPAAFRY